MSNPDDGREVVEIVARAIEQVYSFRMSLVRLVDGVHTYELVTDDGRWEFGSPEDAYEKLGTLKAEAQARAILTAIEASGRWRIVPVEPTEVMSNEGWDAGTAMIVSYGFAIGGEQEVWKAMLSASPKATG